MSTSACRRGPTPFHTAMSAAEAARRKGDFDEERRHFAQAAQRATRPKDAAEARYRSAASWIRQGEHEKGATSLEAFATEYPDNPRAARSWLDAGRAWERAHRQESALLAYTKVFLSYGDSGVAGSAVDRIVAIQSERDGSARHEAYRQLLGSNKSASLDEVLRYRYARALEDVSLADAVLAYEDVARNHPLPQGSFSDEALLRAASLRRTAGDPHGALSTLDLLLEQGGKAAFLGSYTRTTYVEALLLRGRILRDDLKQPERAREAFLLLPKRFPHSRLVDDALWENIITLRRQGHNTCSAAERLRQLSPQSRYLRCEDYLCGRQHIPTSDDTMCQRWLVSIEKP
jgi:tetratricopeptide (TPR) repeat protein